LEALLGSKLGEASLTFLLRQLAGITKTSLVGVDEVFITLVRGDRVYSAGCIGQ